MASSCQILDHTSYFHSFLLVLLAFDVQCESRFQTLNSMLLQFLWNKHNAELSMVLISWDVIFQPKYWDGLCIIHTSTHIHARRETLMKKMFGKTTIWCHYLWDIIDGARVMYIFMGTGNSMIDQNFWRTRYIGSSLPTNNVF